MDALQWTYLDKSAWGFGPWQDEPDKVQYTDEATGLPCLVVRNPFFGYLCGYVGVREGHELYGVHFAECPQRCGAADCQHAPERALQTHGTINHSELCDPDGEVVKVAICHETEGEDRVWWFGYDCARPAERDYTPHPAWTHFARKVLRGGPLPPPPWVYRSFEYVIAVNEGLAAQLAASAPAAKDARRGFTVAARSLVGAPFEMGGRDPQRGIDCVGIVVHAASQVGIECPRLNVRAALVRRWWPSLPPPEAKPELDADLLEALAADLRPVEVAELARGDVALLRFRWIGGAWYHIAVIDSDQGGELLAIHANPYTKLVERRPLVHPRIRGQHSLGSWDRCIVSAYRLPG